VTARRSLPERPTLADLITYARGDGTYFDLENRMPMAKDPKSGMMKPSPGYKALSKWVNAPLEGFPARTTIANLAAGLGFSEERIVLACCESMGIPVRRPGSRLEVLLSTLPDDLPAEVTDAIMAVARVHLGRPKRTGGTGS
jgi:hypothetical protein